jgi:trk system potassium uptake protein TrkA
MNFVVIGLGNYGASLAKKLSAMGHEVIGVDNDLSKVEFYKDRISSTICLDATDIHAIRSLPLADADMVVVAIGDDFGASVMITALLKKLGVTNIISRESSSIHITVMNALGIVDTVNPEYDSAQIFAEKLVMRGVKDIFSLSREIKIAEVRIPPSMVGQLLDTQFLKQEYNLETIALKRRTSHASNGNGDLCKVFTCQQLNESLQIEQFDYLVVLGNRNDIQQLIKSL